MNIIDFSNVDTHSGQVKITFKCFGWAWSKMGKLIVLYFKYELMD